ncbi:MAG: type II toxin-antitoxin system VapC family toxin [Acidimicrobiales bacterium]
MTSFADSSVIVKLYVPEAGHTAVRRLERPLVISGLAVVEVTGALWRKQRLGELDPTDAAVLVRAFMADCAETDDASRFVTIAATSAVLRHAARLVARHPLRAYDAVQLASAMAARAALAEPMTFAAADRALNVAAAAEGLLLAPMG